MHRQRDTVDFQQGLSGTITLTSGPLMINKRPHHHWPGATVITVSGNKALEVFNIPAPFTVTISGLTIANGSGEPAAAFPMAAANHYRLCG